MHRFVMLAGAIAVLCGFLAQQQVNAAASDYVFEAVQPDLKQGEGIVAVRLVHKPTGKPVADAVIVRSRIDMAPDKMADMEAQLTPVQSNEPGVYAFKTELVMAGRWQFSISAKVQGEPETVVGKITFKVAK